MRKQVCENWTLSDADNVIHYPLGLVLTEIVYDLRMDSSETQVF